MLSVCWPAGLQGDDHMRRGWSILAAAFLLTGCAGTKKSNVDVDLAGMSSTVVYSEVFNMMMDPEPYVGKTVRMDGTLNVFHDPRTGEDYFSCVIADATACCAQGIEFVWAGEHSYPDDYPPLDSEIEVSGTFTRYEQEGQVFYHVSDASLEQI